MSSPGNGLPDGYNLNAYTTEGNTGTGSQADPFIPTTCNGFMWAVLQTDKYVKLTTLIDFSRDDNYKNGIAVNLAILCKALYADTILSDGTLPGINGLSVGAQFFISMQATYDQSIDNVSFLNCIWSRTNDSLSVWWSMGAYTCTVTGCIFSLLIKQNGQHSMFEYADRLGIQFISCSQYFTFSGEVIGGWSSNTPVSALAYARQNCTVQLSNYVYYTLSTTLSQNVQFIGSSISSGSGTVPQPLIKDSTIYGDVHLIISGSSNGLRFYNIDHLCIALNITYENTSMTYAPQFIWQNPKNVIIVDKDIIDTRVSLPSATGVNYLTTAQMKSDTYLTQIGFLP